MVPLGPKRGTFMAHMYSAGRDDSIVGALPQLTLWDLDSQGVRLGVVVSSVQNNTS